MAAEDEPIICEICRKGRVTKRVQWSDKGYIYCRAIILIDTCDNCGVKSSEPESDKILDDAFQQEYNKNITSCRNEEPASVGYLPRFQHVHNITNLPKPLADTSRLLVLSAGSYGCERKLVHRKQRDRIRMVLDLLRERIREPCNPARVHPNIEISPFRK